MNRDIYKLEYSFIIKVKKISIFQLVVHLFTARRKFLGYTMGSEVEVFEVNFPFFGSKRRDATIIHEIGHLEINEKGLKQIEHEKYDIITNHGLSQHKWHEIEMRDWEYTNEGFKLLC